MPKLVILTPNNLTLQILYINSLSSSVRPTRQFVGRTGPDSRILYETTVPRFNPPAEPARTVILGFCHSAFSVTLRRIDRKEKKRGSVDWRLECAAKSWPNGWIMGGGGSGQARGFFIHVSHPFSSIQWMWIVNPPLWERRDEWGKKTIGRTWMFCFWMNFYMDEKKRASWGKKRTGRRLMIFNDFFSGWISISMRKITGDFTVAFGHRHPLVTLVH